MREVLRDKHSCKKLRLNNAQKKRLANTAINLNKHILEDIIKIFQPKTVLSWHHDLVGKKYDSTGSPDGGKTRAENNATRGCVRSPETCPQEP